MPERILACDTESTGISINDGHRLTEVAFIEVIDRQPTGRVFHHYLDPEREVPDQAVAVHGMNRDDLILAGGGKKFADIAEDMLSFIDGSPLIIHNANFDMKFFDHELNRLGMGTLSERVAVFDTLRHAQKLHPGQRNNLDALAKRYKVKERDRSFHGALLDSEILLDVYLCMTREQNNFSFQTQSSEPTKKARDEISSTEVSKDISEKLKTINISREEEVSHFNFF